MKKKKIVVFTGAGVSSESGISTFREKGGLWDEYDPDVIANIKTWRKGKEEKQMMLDFYNQRRTDLLSCVPNDGHKYITKLEEIFDVTVITQNVDDLHEKSGSSNILHLHGELNKMQSSMNSKLVYPCNKNIQLGDKCEYGSQLRPHVVLFGEDVPNYNKALKIVKDCDCLIVVGTSLKVQPANCLVDAIGINVPIFVIDNHVISLSEFYNHELLFKYNYKASEGMKKVYEYLYTKQDLDIHE